MSRICLVWPIVALVNIAAAAGQSSAPNQSWPIREAPPELRMTISRADLVILTMHDALLRELQEGLARGGPRSALAACHSNSAAVS